MSQLTESEYTLSACRKAVSIISGKWRMSILLASLQGPVRYKAYRQALPGISEKVLAAELRTLTLTGILERKTFDQSPPRVEYQLTERGQRLKPLIMQLEATGALFLS